MATMWYYSSKNQQKGPVSYDELSGLAQSGHVRSTDLVWEEGSPDWVKASTVRGLFDGRAEGSRIDGPRAEASRAGATRAEGANQVRADEPAPRRRGGGDDDDFDDRPRRSIRRPKKASSSNGLMIGLIAGGAGLVIIAVIIIIVVANSGGRRPPDVAVKPGPIVVPPMPGPGPMPGPFPGPGPGPGPGLGGPLPAARPIVPNPLGASSVDTLTNADPLDPARGGCHCKVYQAMMVPGKLYTIDMIAGFDTFLRLVDSRGNQVAFDDDGGEGLNARIVFRPAAADTYRIVCTSCFPNETGAFTLSIREN